MNFRPQNLINGLPTGRCLFYCRDASITSVVLNLWVATENWVAGNIQMGREYYQNHFHFIKQTLIKLNKRENCVENKLKSTFHCVWRLCRAITLSRVVGSDVFLLCNICVLDLTLLRNNPACFMRLLTVCRVIFTAAIRLYCSLSLPLLFFQLVSISFPCPHARHDPRIPVTALVQFLGLQPCIFYFTP
jgi:hypothetical protein